MSDDSRWTVLHSPVGDLTVIAGAKGISRIHWDGLAPELDEAARSPLPEAEAQLEAFFAGEREAFELDLDLAGSPLQLAVWQRLLEIPFGETTTYGGIARSIDEELYSPDLEAYRRPRVVGQEVGRNPVPIVVACHRVIGADGSLTGFFGGLDRKRFLLGVEGWDASGATLAKRSDEQLALL